MKPKETQRFAVRMKFENGEVKKYGFSISAEDENAKVVNINGYMFTDEIFSNGWIAKCEEHEHNDNFNQGQCIEFTNGFIISADQLYKEGTPFSSPIIHNNEVYRDAQIRIIRQAQWDGCRLHKDEETGLIKVALPGCEAFNTKCIATYAFPDGQRAIDIEFNYLGSFHEGIAHVGIKNKGYGYIDKNMNFITPPKYNFAYPFHNGFAVASIWDEENKKSSWLFVDKGGKEHRFENEYLGICENSEGMFRVSNFTLGTEISSYTLMNLLHYSDHDVAAGCWGYADSNGKEIIKPQYIFAFDFQKNGLALVCKGKWEWTNEGEKTFLGEKTNGGYRSDEHLWGMIDKNGKEVIACKFDEIETLDYGENEKYLKAHYGGWREGKWGIIDFKGNWIVEPIFEALGYEVSQDDCIPFYAKENFYDAPQGLYSMKEQKIILEPKFLDIDFEDDGNLKVEIYDEKLRRNVEQIIDKTGKTLFKSRYTFLFPRKNYYETRIRNADGDLLHGLIDREGNEVLPCKYTTASDGILIDEQKIFFKEHGKCGMMDFNENIIIKPIYDDLLARGNFIYAILGEGNDKKYGLLTKDGKIIFPVKYNSISVNEKTIITTDDKSASLYRIE